MRLFLRHFLILPYMCSVFYFSCYLLGFGFSAKVVCVFLLCFCYSFVLLQACCYTCFANSLQLALVPRPTPVVPHLPPFRPHANPHWNFHPSPPGLSNFYCVVPICISSDVIGAASRPTAKPSPCVISKQRRQWQLAVAWVTDTLSQRAPEALLCS